MSSDNEKIKWTDKASVALSFSALLSSICVAWIALNLTCSQQKWQETIRRNEIAPDIQLSAETGLDQKTLERATIVFENIGRGTAQNIMVWIRYLDTIRIAVIQEFIPLNGGPEQNYIKPNEKLKFFVDLVNILGEEYPKKTLNEKIEIVPRLSWTFYFSYFDIDGNEKLLVTTVNPAGIGAGIILHTGAETLDSIFLSLPPSRKHIYEEKDIDIRDEFGLVKKELIE
ncbi:MAG: hypothetical protein L0196_06630 [candidate division Zixibacteria bacterium]|nr:hypothetical protein [candidate division Zixibacteria bacterium]